MSDVLVDTSTIWDLVLYCQQRHRRNRSVASSAAAAIESLVIYDRPLLESTSADFPAEVASSSRFLRFFCDTGIEAALGQFESLASCCGRLQVSKVDSVRIQNLAFGLLEDTLAPIADPEDLRAYELYDYLPYHLGEDPTAIECSLTDPTAVDLQDVVSAGSAETEYFRRVAACLRDRLHPTRAAWALPLARLFYYQALQVVYGVHFAPQATKSTLAFGREAETVTYRRLLSYCVETVRYDYLKRAESRLGGMMILLPIPAFAPVLLNRLDGWGAFTQRIVALRDDKPAVGYRAALLRFLANVEQSPSIESGRACITAAYEELVQRCSEWERRLQLGGVRRTIRMALPFSVVKGASGMMLVHDLHAAIGIARVPAAPTPQRSDHS